jgi:hypothetical protein
VAGDERAVAARLVEGVQVGVADAAVGDADVDIVGTEVAAVDRGRTGWPEDGESRAEVRMRSTYLLVGRHVKWSA